MRWKPIDLTGRRFGRLTVLKFDKKVGLNSKWICRCDCGNEKSVFGNTLVVGSTKTCGCLKQELCRASATKHGGAAYGKTKEYKVWSALKNRTLCRTSSAFENYGGRGITVAPEWIKSFEQFALDMGKSPPGTSLDRIDNNRGYEPGNCRWATPQQQNSNKRSNVVLEFQGRSQTLSQWAREVGFSVSCVCGRLKAGWAVDRALTKPPQKIR